MTNTIVWLSQLQFLASLGFMVLFLLLEMGLAWTLLFFKLADHAATDNVWMQAYRFWVRIYALAAILALAGSIPVLIQLGSLWPGLFDRIGDIAGPLLAAAILTTFIVKSCFMSAMLFGQRSLSNGIHTVVVSLVALGTTLSVFWGAALIGWMQHPVGVDLINEEYVVVDWYSVVFNQFTGWLLLLFAAAAGFVVAFLMLGLIARNASSLPADDSGRQVFRCGAVIGLAAVVLYSVGIVGYGQKVVTYQPAKAAATAAYWYSGRAPQLVLFGWPQVTQSETRASVALNGVGARWLGRNVDGVAQGLDRFSGMHPPVAMTFWSLRISMLIALLMALTSCGAWWCLRRKYVEHGDLPTGWRWWFSGLTWTGWLIGAALLCHVLAGLAPFVVNQTITFTEVVGGAHRNSMIGSILAQLCVFGVLLAGFMQLLRHGVQYGVVPVARRRGRA